MVIFRVRFDAVEEILTAERKELNQLLVDVDNIQTLNAEERDLIEYDQEKSKARYFSHTYQ